MPERTTRWIDVHAHFSLPTTAEQRQQALAAMHALDFLAPEPFEWTPERALRAMDANGIDKQLLSAVPTQLDALRATNEYGSELTRRHPDRFGLLAALPTDDADACRAEIARSATTLNAVGFAVSSTYNGVVLGDRRLDPVWSELDRRHATVFVHPDTTIGSRLGVATPLIEVTFETTRVILDLLYQRFFLRFPNLRFVLAHGGGVLPALSGRIQLLGNEPWVRNESGVTTEELAAQMRTLYLDTAAAGSDSQIAAALEMTTAEHLVYGGDSGVPCTDEASVARNLSALRHSKHLSADHLAALAGRAEELFTGAIPS